MGILLRNWWWWTADYAYALIWQVLGTLGRPAAAYARGTRRPIVIIPGIYESWQFMRPLVERLHDAGHPVHVVAGLKRNHRPVAHAAQVVADYIELHGLDDVLIVAHSKGGMIGKLLMSRLDPEARVDRMVAICSPFSGSWYANWMWLPSLRSFSPRDATTVALGLELGVNERITSIFGLFDPHIPGGSELQGARNERVQTGGHFRILGDRRVVRLVLAEADR